MTDTELTDRAYKIAREMPHCLSVGGVADLIAAALKEVAEEAVNRLSMEANAGRCAIKDKQDEIDALKLKLAKLTEPVADEKVSLLIEYVENDINGDYTTKSERRFASALLAKTAALKEAEERIAASVPRSRYDMACEQYTECEKERKRLFDALRALEKKS